VTTEDFDEIVRQIQEGESTPVFSESNNKTLHLVKLRDEEMIVVYDKRRKVPVTVIPPDSHDQYLPKEPVDV
jgi:hypothetical protein